MAADKGDVMVTYRIDEEGTVFIITDMGDGTSKLDWASPGDEHYEEYLQLAQGANQ